MWDLAWFLGISCRVQLLLHSSSQAAATWGCLPGTRSPPVPRRFHITSQRLFSARHLCGNKAGPNVPWPDHKAAAWAAQSTILHSPIKMNCPALAEVPFGSRRLVPANFPVSCVPLPAPPPPLISWSKECSFDFSPDLKLLWKCPRLDAKRKEQFSETSP